MKTTGNTILITGGGSGIGRGLAEAFHKLGNHVIIAGRRQKNLDETIAANPGMAAETFDIENASSIQTFARHLADTYPNLNIVINNAGIMRPEDLLAQPDGLADVESTIATNLLGPIRLIAALLPQLRRQDRSTIINVTSGLAFVPLAFSPTYNATKAALHSYTQALRYQLKSTNVEVVELIPPYVATELMGSSQASDPRALPLQDFLNETLEILKTQPTPPEILVERVKPLRFAAESGKEKYDAFFKTFNDAMTKAPH